MPGDCYGPCQRGEKCTWCGYGTETNVSKAALTEVREVLLYAREAHRNNCEERQPCSDLADLDRALARLKEVEETRRAMLAFAEECEAGGCAHRSAFICLRAISARLRGGGR